MARQLLTDELVNEFRKHEEFTTSEIRQFYKNNIANIKDSTINWKVYHLIKVGVIERKKIGVFKIVK